RKRLYLIIGGILFFLLMLGDEDSEMSDVDNTQTVQIKEENAKDKSKKEASKLKLSPEQEEQAEQNYQLALAKFQEGDYVRAKDYIGITISIDPNYKDTQSLSKLIQEGLDQIVRLKDQAEKEKERKARQIKINAILEKLRTAVKERQIEVSRSLIGQVYKLDPENIDVPPLKAEIDAYEEQLKREKAEKDRAKAIRQDKLDKLQPGKALFLKGEWYKAIDRLEKFLQEKDMDEDLTLEATKMLKDSKSQLRSILNPLLSKARSFKEGEDLKQSYETYGDVLKFDPSNEEALNNRDKIFDSLRNRSRKVYREALVAESLSLYSKAKEKFQEVQQISPINSEYYNKATNKLKNYLE
ncbi:MAG: hypothetical protein OEW87_09315, partial [Flavobacteriaceae bacterium]|nr:hypothetical protein [Flavobacteriaceae bacterium]